MTIYPDSELFLQREDIPQPQSPSIYLRQRDEDDTIYLTLQYFPRNNLQTGTIQLLVPHNVDIWQPVNKHIWPTDTIFNFVYASAVLKLWICPEFAKGASSEYKKIADESSQELKRKQRENYRQALLQKWQCQARATKGSNENCGVGSNDQEEQGNQDEMGGNTLEDENLEDNELLEGDEDIDISSDMSEDDFPQGKDYDIIDHVLMRMRSQHQTKPRAESPSYEEKVRTWKEGLPDPILDEV